VVIAEIEGGFDPTRIATAVRDAGFGPAEIRLEAEGRLEHHEGLLALRLPGPPHLLILEGGDGFEGLKACGPPVGSRVRVEGHLHPSHAEKPAGMEVDEWEEPEEKQACAISPGEPACRSSPGLCRWWRSRDTSPIRL
jgi:hypothetical protein